MIDLNLVVARLKEQDVPRVLGIIEYSDLVAPPTQLPAHYVIPFDIAAAPNRLSGVHDQRITEDFAVVSVVEGQALRSSLPSTALRVQVKLVWDALIAWRIPDTAIDVELVGGQLLSAGGRQAVWRSRFRTAYHLRRPAQ